MWAMRLSGHDRSHLELQQLLEHIRQQKNHSGDAATNRIAADVRGLLWDGGGQGSASVEASTKAHYTQPAFRKLSQADASRQHPLPST
jgi:hypothetical protein